MSDDNQNGAWNANQGIILPEGAGAAYNIGLSPLSITRASNRGDDPVEEYTIIPRGQNGRLWASTVSTARSNFAFFLTIEKDTISPSDRWSQSSTWSLRCLVSKSQASE